MGCILKSVHDDIKLGQWLRLPNGQLKLGDFNRAEFMEYNRRTKRYCKYNNGEAHGIVGILCGSCVWFHLVCVGVCVLYMCVSL